MNALCKIIGLFQFKCLQKLYFWLYKITLGLMNYGVGGEENGEKYLLKQLNTYFHKHKISPIIFDIGGNIGQYANLLNAEISVKRKIYSFEPSKNTLKKFIKNTNFIKDIYITNVGFGEAEANLELFYAKDGNDPDNSCASLYPDNISNYVSGNVEKEIIHITTLDIWCKENNIQHIDYLKIDIEGNELACLKGGKMMLHDKKIDVIQVEHNRCAISSRTFFKDYYDLLHEDYHIYRELSRKHGLVKIESYEPALENFTYINYVLIRKGVPFIS